MKRLVLFFLLVLLIAPLVYADSSDVGIERVLNDAWNDEQNSLRVGLVSGDNVNVEITSSSSIRTGQKTNTATIATVLSVDSIVVRNVTVSRNNTNTGNIYIGLNNTITSDNGFVLSKDTTTAIKLDVDNVQDIFFTSQYTGEGVNWVAEIR